jgi:hypothetical protein
MNTPQDSYPETGQFGESMLPLSTPSLIHPRSFADLLPEVLRAASLNWRLYPVQPQGRFAATKALLEEATNSREQLEKWAVEYPGCNWALATGQASGIFVIEMDGERGRDALYVLSGHEWDWQQTLQSQAGYIGYAFFRWPAELSMRNAGKKIAPGVSIRGEGDSVLISPSKYSSGVSHTWLNPDATVAACPQSLLESVFAVSEGQVFGKILLFPKAPPQKAVPAGLSSDVRRLFAYTLPMSNPNARHRIYLSFQFRGGGWRCQFLEKDLQAALPRKLNLATPERVIALVERGGGLTNLESRQALDLAFATGKGGVFLNLTSEQYAQLQKECRPNRLSEGRVRP